MIDWITISLALVIIAILVGIFGFMAWKINMPDPLISANLTGKKDDGNQFLDLEKKKKEKSGNDQSKKKRKEQKKSKRDNKDDDQQRQTVKFKEPSTQTSEETDNEREESEQESSTPQIVETSSKVRHRNRKKARPTTLPSTHIEGILVNKDEKSPVTTRAEPIPHPKLEFLIPKDEVELAKQHQQQNKIQGNKSTQGSNKQTVPSHTSVPVKKSVPTLNNTNQRNQQQQQQQQLQEQQEQPFTTVGSNRHKAGTPPSQQQNKSISASLSSSSPSSTTAATVAAAATVPAPLTQQQQQQHPVQNQPEQLPQRQVSSRQQKEIPTQLNGFNSNSQPVKQSVVTSAPPPTKLADLVKALPTSQAVVTELMLALDAFPLSTDELDIIMHKIANKQSVIKQDWSKLQHGQKVDPQAHIGQVLDESARAYQEDMKTNAIKHIKELTDERENDKRRINELIKETNDKDLNIKALHNQLSTIQHPQQHQQQMQTFQAEFKRISEENLQLKQRLAQQQQHFQQQQISSLNLVNNNNGGDPVNTQFRVISEQIKKLSVDNGNLEKQLKTKDLLLKDQQKEKDNLLHSNQQLIQKLQESQKQHQINEDKLLKELNDIRTLNINQLNDYKRRIEQLELENEQLKQAEISQNEIKSVSNNEDREKLEQLIQENEQYKIKFNEIQNQYQSQENQLRQEIEQLKSAFGQNQYQLTTANTQLDTLRAELEQAKANNDSTNAQLDQQKYKQFLVELLEQDVRNQLPNHTEDFNQWLSSYQQIFTSNVESNKRALQDESAALKRENDQLHKNMTDVANQLKEIEQTVQSKEELLLADLKNKDITLKNIEGENDHLNKELQRVQAEIIRLQLAHDTAVNDNRTLKLQLDERHLINTNSPSTTTDDSYEFVKQQSPSPAEIDPRAEELNQLIRSTKEVLENQDSLVQQLDKHIDGMHHGGTGEISNVDDSTVSSSSSSDQPQSQS